MGVRGGIAVEESEFSFSSGAEVGFYANIAKFTTNITTGTGNCSHKVEEVYSMAIGAQAGATLALAGNSWGPMPAEYIDRSLLHHNC